MFQEIFALIISTVSSLYIMIVLLRFILQFSRADFYNPISQFIAKATNPVLIPLRRIIPGFGGLDMAAIVLATLIQSLALFLQQLIGVIGISDPLGFIIIPVVLVFGLILKIYFFALIIMIIASWVAPGSGHPALVLVNQICEPVMKPFRNLLPPMGGIDLSPILVFLSLQVVAIIISHLAASLGFGWSLI